VIGDSLLHQALVFLLALAAAAAVRKMYRCQCLLKTTLHLAVHCFSSWIRQGGCLLSMRDWRYCSWQLPLQPAAAAQPLLLQVQQPGMSAISALLLL
jgi:hypothetical protein